MRVQSKPFSLSSALRLHNVAFGRRTSYRWNQWPSHLTSQLSFVSWLIQQQQLQATLHNFPRASVLSLSCTYLVMFDLFSLRVTAGIHNSCSYVNLLYTKVNSTICHFVSGMKHMGETAQGHNGSLEVDVL